MAKLLFTVKPSVAAGTVKFGLCGLWLGSATTTTKLSAVLDAIFDAVSWIAYSPPTAFDGTLSVAGVAHDLAVLSVAEPSSNAPLGPPRICQKQVVGLPVLVLLSVIGPRRGLPLKVTVVFPVDGVKFAVIGFSPMTMVC